MAAESRKPKTTHAVVAFWLDTSGRPCWKVTIDTLNAAGEIVRSRLLHKRDHTKKEWALSSAIDTASEHGLPLVNVETFYRRGATQEI
jgi:hypothetical protein